MKARLLAVAAKRIDVVNELKKAETLWSGQVPPAAPAFGTFIGDARQLKPPSEAVSAYFIHLENNILEVNEV